MIRLTLIIFISFAVSLSVKASPVKVDYNIIGNCRLKKLPMLFSGSEKRFKSSLVSFFEQDAIKEMYFSLNSDKSVMQVTVVCSKKITAISYTLDGVNKESVSSFFSSEVGLWLSRERLAAKKKSAYSSLLAKGFSNIKISIDQKQLDKGVLLDVSIRVTPPPIIGGVNFSNPDVVKQLSLQRVFNSYIGEKYKKSLLSQLTIRIRKKLKGQGVFFSRLKQLKSFFAKGKIFIRYQAKLGSRIGINVNGYGFLHRTMKQEIQNALLVNSDDFKPSKLKTIISKVLHKKGYYNVDQSVRIVTGVDTMNYPYKHIFISLRNGNKVKIEDVQFVGIDPKQLNEVKNYFFKEGPDLIKSKYYEEEYVSSFSDYLKKRLLSQGILYVKVNRPTIMYKENGTKVVIRYIVQKGEQFLLKKLTTNLPKKHVELVKIGLKNQEGSPFNPLALKEDLQMLLQQVLSEGYFYARYKSLVPEKIVDYDLTNNTVKVNVEFENLIKTRVSDYFVIGNKKTKDWVIQKILDFKREQLLTPTLLAEYKTRLLRSGLFSTVDIQNLYDETRNGEDFYRLMIKVDERKAGRLVVTPGYRNDLGLKLDTQINYGNIWGGNETIGANFRFNQRLNNALDQIRTNMSNNLLEWNVGMRYQDPFIFQSSVQYDTKLGYIRERYYSFDADIKKLTTNFQRSFGKYLTISVSHQLEQVRQYNADSAINEASFEIGSFTPRLIIDTRDSRVRPQSGGKLDLSWEFANPYFLAMKTDELTINYNKVVIRNAYYIKTSFGTIALMAAMGAQKNFATEDLVRNGQPVYWADGTRRKKGYIPSIKVFRLEGAYNVRGYSFDESNKLVDGVDISTKVVQDMAYFSLFKVEPRYFYSDNIVMAMFFDAGRVFYDQFQPFRLRTSVGLSFKYVTPVGTIDLDYGMKLNRVQGAEGHESFGRLHFAIGFF